MSGFLFKIDAERRLTTTRSPGVSGIGAVYAQTLVQKYGAVESVIERALADKARAFPSRLGR